MKKRTRSRELALQFLYQIDLLGSEILDDARNRLRRQRLGRPSDQISPIDALVVINFLSNNPPSGEGEFVSHGVEQRDDLFAQEWDWLTLNGLA